MTINQLVTGFIEKSIEIGDLEPIDSIYIRNRLLNLIGLESYQEEAIENIAESRLDILDELVEFAVETKKIDDLGSSRDILAAQIMDLVTK